MDDEEKEAEEGKKQDAILLALVVAQRKIEKFE